MMRNFIGLCVLALLAGCAQVERLALPAPELLNQTWTVSSQTRQVHVDHSPWTRILQRHVQADTAGVHRFDYANVTTRDRTALTRYLERLQSMDTRRLTRAQQLAYWINLYNAATVDLVLDHYPVGSIREITDGGLSFGPWDRKILQVQGQALSLNDIEHRIIRPIFREPRIHYALNCAAAGCPNLARTAWTASRLETALEAAERAYVNDPRGVTVEADGDIILSKIFIWFQEDFGQTEADVLARLATKAEPELKAALTAADRVAGYQYDWSLNAP
jgi:hypothetical protein